MSENCAAIVIAATHHELSKIKDTRGTTKTVGALRCKFEFRTNDWLDAVKTAMFCNGDALLHPEVADNAIAVPLDSDNECPVPYEVLEDTLPYSIGVWGVTDDGLRIVSRWLVFGTQVGCYTKGSAPESPDPTIYETILMESRKAVNIANDVTNRADNGEFNGKSAYEIAVDDGYKGTETEWLASLKGEKGDQGLEGEDGYTPQREIDYWTNNDKLEIETYVDQKVIENYSDLNDKISIVESIASGAEKAISYVDYSHMVSALNELPKDFFVAGNGINIVTVGVPDLWVVDISDNKDIYTYTTDQAIIDEINANSVFKVGYFYLGQKETQKVDLVDYAKKSQVPTLNATLKDNGAYTLTISMGVIE